MPEVTIAQNAAIPSKWGQYSTNLVNALHLTNVTSSINWTTLNLSGDIPSKAQQVLLYCSMTLTAGAGQVILKVRTSSAYSLSVKELYCWLTGSPFNTIEFVMGCIGTSPKTIQYAVDVVGVSLNASHIYIKEAGYFFGKDDNDYILSQ